MGSNFSSPVVLLFPAQLTGNLEIRCGAMVREVLTGPDGHATGVSYIDKATGHEVQVKGKVIMLAASACETVRLLLNSRGPRFPNGLANSSGLIGHLSDGYRHAFTRWVARGWEMIRQCPCSMGETKEQSDSPGIGLRFQRRAMLKMMMAIPVAGLIPLASLAGELGRTVADAPPAPDPSMNRKLRILTLHEWATVGVLSDWIIPADEESGSATDAGVPEFIDDWLDFQGGTLLVEIRKGLEWLDAECSRRFGRNFVNCASDEQQQMLDRIAWPEAAAVNDVQSVAFFRRFRDLALSGFYTSEIAIRYLLYVGNEPQGEWQGCPLPVLVKLGVQVFSPGT